MTDKRPWLQRVALHPLLFAIYPILALLAFNVAELNVSAGVRALLLSMTLAVILFLVFRWIFRDSMQGALAASTLLILFYSYGHVYNLLTGGTIGGLNLFRHRTLIPLWLILAALMIWWVSRRSRHIATLTYFLNIVGVFLLITPIFQLTSFLVKNEISNAGGENDPRTLDLKVGDNPPDIYYIILDGYGRADVLQRYGYDNSPFLNSLRDLGFVVADCAQSNYAQTKLSLSSSLNFNYLDALSDRYVSGSNDRTGLDTFIHDNAVRKSLEKAGYKTVGFASGFPMTELTDAEYYLAPKNSWWQTNDFESLLLRTTLAGVIRDQDASEDPEMPNSDPNLSRARTLFTLEQLPQVPYLKGPKFVFVHLVIPHPPYVFGPTGGPRAPAQPGLTRTEQSDIFYRDQAMYISSRIMEIVPKLIANSTTPPVIVIQGDHGPTAPSASRDRMKILNVYFLPGVDVQIEPTITPVNTFRIIFNEYFGQKLKLLENESLYSVYRHPFDYKVISNSCKAND